MAAFRAGAATLPERVGLPNRREVHEGRRWLRPESLL